MLPSDSLTKHGQGTVLPRFALTGTVGPQVVSAETPEMPVERGSGVTLTGLKEGLERVGVP